MAEPLKNKLDKSFILRLSRALDKSYEGFSAASFLRNVLNKEWKDLELKQRLSHICRVMAQHLPSEYPKALEAVLKAAPDFSGFEALFFPEFVATYGLDKKHVKISRQALVELTQYSSAEFAVRPFIMGSPQSTMQWMLKLSNHKNYHVRRLASEGCRPRLPWAPALPEFKNDPGPILPILEKLKNDPELYVQRSVANNLNDIAKDNPEITLRLAKNWAKNKPTKETMWIINHGLRSLVKAGHPQALAIVGYSEPKQLKIGSVRLSSQSVTLGDKLGFQFSVANNSTKTQNLMIDYIVHHRKKNGEQTPKVFKLKKVKLSPGETLHINKRHHFKEISTRKYYSGQHALQLQVNGKTLPKKRFELTTP